MFTKLNQSLVFRLCLLLFALGWTAWSFVNYAHEWALFVDLAYRYEPGTGKLLSDGILFDIQLILAVAPTVLAFIYLWKHPKAMNITKNHP